MPLSDQYPRHRARLNSARKAITLLSGLVSALALATAAHSAPITTLDRNGAWVSVEAFGPNVIHVTIAADKAEALKGVSTSKLHWDDAAQKLTATGTLTKSVPSLVRIMAK